MKSEDLDKIAAELVATVAHQLKSPLNAIKGFSSLLKEGQYGEMSAKAREVISRIHASSERAIDLVNNLLDLKKIEEGQMKYSFKKIDLVQAVKSVVEELRPIAEGKGLDLEFGSETPEFMAEVDKIYFHQVVQNLIDNSIKYTEKGWIRVSLFADEEHAIIKVADSGKGITEEVKKSLFNRFDRGAMSKEIIEGTGLGLFIARNIIEAHKGKIWVESKGAGKGSEFYIKIPILRP